MVTKMDDIIRANVRKGENGYILDFWDIISNPDNIDIVGAELKKRLEGKNYNIIAGVNEEGLALATILGRKFGLGMCYTGQKSFPTGYEIVPRGGVKDKNVLMATGIITDGYSCYDSARRIIRSGGIPETIATVVDYDNIDGMPAKQRVLGHLQTGDPEIDIDVVSLVRISEIKL